MSKWNRFFYQAHKVAVLWLFIVLYLFLFRFIFIAVFHDNIQTSTVVRDISRMALLGLRYDILFATFWVLIPILCSAAGVFFGREAIAERVCGSMGSVFAVLASALCVISIIFYREYHEPFNYLVFNVYYDDSKAILATIWADYHPLIYFMVISVVATISLTIKRRIVDRGLISRERIAAWTASSLRQAVALIVVLALFKVGLDESAFGRVLRDRYDGVTSDELLNKSAPNPFMALERAFLDHLIYSGRTGINTYLPDRDVRKAARAVLPVNAPQGNLDDYMRRVAAGAKNKPPRHIVLICIESFDSWPLEPRFASLELMNNLGELSREGLTVTNFLPAAHFTMQSFSALLTSIPYTTGVEINYQPSARSPYPSSIAAEFRRLGYRTRLFYGGLLTWQRIGDFAREQGFEETYGAPHIQEALGNVEWTDWGVLDEYLYRFVLRKIDPDQPSFDVILTTTDHPPFEMDMETKGYPVKTIPPELAPVFDGHLSLRKLGYRWYSDHTLGVFVRKAEAKLPRALFAITGDHFSRRFPNVHPTFFEQSAVPFVLYGKDVLKGLSISPRTIGTHIDIAPTLIELAAPKGFVYHSVGRNLIGTAPQSLAVGYHKVIGPDFIADLDTDTIHRLPGKPLPEKLPDVAALKTTFNDYWGIAWWRVKHGADF
jgi:phosphoglycerol transferase MdoB-like AlkP superfamily enzyme